MKKFFVISLVIALFLATAAPALAARGPQAGPIRSARVASTAITAAGKITSLDSVAKTVTFSVVSGSPSVKPLIGQALTVQTTPTTRFLLKTDTGTVVVTFDALTVDQKISVQGTVADNLWTAQRITIGAQLIHQP